MSVNMKEGIDPLDWAYQEADTSRSYEKFQYYLSIGPDRKLQDVADHFGIAHSTVAELSYTYGWTSRAGAHDAYYRQSADETERQKSVHDHRQDIKKQELDDYNRLLGIWRDKLTKLEESGGDFSSRELNEFMNTRDKISTFVRRSLSMATRGGAANVEDTTSEDDYEESYEITEEGTLITRNKLSAED